MTPSAREVAVADRPASAVALRPLGVAELLDGAVRLVRRNARVAFAVAVPFAVARTVLVALFTLATDRSKSATTWQFLVGLVIAGVLGTLLTATLARLFSSDLLGVRLGARAALAGLWRAAFALILLAIVVTLLDDLGLVALVVGGVWLWGVWAVAAPALVLEWLGPFRALGRSFELVRTMFWRTWGIRALGWVLTSVLGFLVTLPFQALAAGVTGTDPLKVATDGISHPTLYVAVISIGTLLSSVLVLPISSAVDVLLYTDLRVRREGMDILLALPAETETEAASAPPPVAAW